MTTNMDDKGAARTTAQDHLRSMLDLMRQGARINLSGIPDDPTFLSSNIPGEIAKEIAALIQSPANAGVVTDDDLNELDETLGALEGRHANGWINITMEERRLFARLLRKEIERHDATPKPEAPEDELDNIEEEVRGILADPANAFPPTPASGEQMKVVAWRIGHKFEDDYVVWTYFDGSDEVNVEKAIPLVTLEAANKALGDRDAEIERLEREVESFVASRLAMKDRYKSRAIDAASRAETAEALNTTLSEALQAAGDEISAAMMDDNKQRFHRLNKLRHTIRTALAALPAKQGGLKEADWGADVGKEILP